MGRTHAKYLVYDNDMRTSSDNNLSELFEHVPGISFEEARDLANKHLKDVAFIVYNEHIPEASKHGAISVLEQGSRFRAWMQFWDNRDGNLISQAGVWLNGTFIMAPKLNMEGVEFLPEFLKHWDS